MFLQYMYLELESWGVPCGQVVHAKDTWDFGQVCLEFDVNLVDIHYIGSHGHTSVQILKIS